MAKHMAEVPMHAIEEQLKVFHHKRSLRKSQSGVETEFRSDAHKFLHDVLHHSAFESCFGIIIMFNLVLVITETDALAKQEVVPAWCEFAGWVVLIVFVVELLVRVFVLQWDFILDGCNIFDFVLIAVDLIFNVLGLLGGKLFPVSFLRIVRLLKLARVTKAFHVFPELRLMMAGLVGSLRAIFWGTVLLSFALITCSILAVQFIHPLNQQLAEDGIYGTTCERCPRAYATVFDASLTFVQQIVAGDAWGTVSVQVIENYPATGIFYAFTFMSIGMAVLNLILGVVVDVASQAREKLRGEMDNEKLMERMEVHSHLLDLCKAMDKDDNGEITKEELHAGYQDSEKFREALAFMDIGEEDLDILWTCLDGDKSGTISYGEFVTSCYKLKSSNTHFTLAYMKYYITIIKDKICEEIEEVRTVVMEEEKKIEDQMVALEAEEQHMAVVMDGEDAKLNKIGDNIEGLVDHKGSKENSRSPQNTDNSADTSMQDAIARLTDVVSTLARSIKESDKTVVMGTTTSEDQQDESKEEWKEGKLYGNNPLPSELDKYQKKFGGKLLLGPYRGLQSQESHILLELLQTTDQQQLELLAAMEEIRHKLGLVGAPGGIRMASMAGSDLQVVPPHAARWLPNCGPNSCRGAPRVEVFSLPSPG